MNHPATPQPVKHPATYEDIERLPENLVGEIIDGELHVQPRPSGPRMPEIPQDQRCRVAPDWVCEILSPSTARKDRIRKMRIYAEQAAAHCWLIDPLARTLEGFVLRDGRWQLEDSFEDDAKFRAIPFQAVELELGLWWTPEGSAETLADNPR